MRGGSSVLLVVVVAVVALPLSASAERASPQAAPTVKVAFNQKLKLKILVSSGGMTLYVWESDGRNKSTCYEGCDSAWRPLAPDGPLGAGNGVKRSLLRVVKRKDGTSQVVYNHHPLYLDLGSADLGLTGDTKPGDINGHGWANWYAVSPKGKAIHRLP